MKIGKVGKVGTAIGTENQLSNMQSQVFKVFKINYVGIFPQNSKFL